LLKNILKFILEKSVTSLMSISSFVIGKLLVTFASAGANQPPKPTKGIESTNPNMAAV